jgi:hypothetical protein
MMLIVQHSAHMFASSMHNIYYYKKKKKNGNGSVHWRTVDTAVLLVQNPNTLMQKILKTQRCANCTPTITQRMIYFNNLA